MKTPKLIGITYSPWTYKARWALAWHGIDHRYKEYLLMLGKVGLRLKMGGKRESVTVPVLFAQDRLLDNSYAIACWADEVGSGTSLSATDPAASEWNDWGDRLSSLGRIRTTLTVADDREALLASVPSPLNRIPGALAIARKGVSYLLKTYPLETPSADIDSEMADLLCRLESAVLSGPYLLGRPSYADIAAATALQMVSPAADEFVPLVEQVRPHWRSETLSERFPKVLAWRDMIFDTMDAPRLGPDNPSTV